MSSPPVPQEFLLVAKTNTHFAHIRAIDAGGGGEVHEGIGGCASCNTNIVIGFRSSVRQGEPLSFSTTLD